VGELLLLEDVLLALFQRYRELKQLGNVYHCKNVFDEK
jgi:hypothetical protein